MCEFRLRVAHTPAFGARSQGSRRRPHRAWLAASLLILAAGLPSSAAAQTVVSLSPDVTIALGAGDLVTADHAVAVDNQLDIVVLQNLGAIPDSADVVAYAEGPGTRRLLAFDTTVSLVGGVVARPGDVAALNGGTYSIVFSASSVGLPPGVIVDAVAVSSAGGLLLSFDTAVSLPGGLHVADEDLVRWNGSVFSLALDGSSAGISRAYDVDAVDDLGPSTFLLSFETGGQIGSVSFADEDVVRYQNGLWSLVRDGSTSDVDWVAADLDAMQMVPEPAGATAIVAGIALIALGAPRRGARSGARHARPRAIGLPALGVLASIFLAGVPAEARDGVLEIQQICAVNGGCFPGDAAGFPVTISTSGSYRLSSNLTMPDAFTGAIEITASHVTIDLNGFAIIGQAVCSGIPIECTPTTSAGDGIVAAGLVEHVRVMNGAIRAMGDDALRLGAKSSVENLRVFSNAGYGIYVGRDSIVTGNVSSENGVNGITMGPGSVVRGNALTRNDGAGVADNCVSLGSGGFVVSENSIVGSGSYGMFIDCEASIITGNSVYDSNFDGIYVGLASTLSGNVVVGNDRHGLANTGGDDVAYTDNVIAASGTADIEPGNGFRNMGGNSCGGTATCP